MAVAVQAMYSLLVYSLLGIVHGIVAMIVAVAAENAGHDAGYSLMMALRVTLIEYVALDSVAVAVLTILEENVIDLIDLNNSALC